MSDKINSGLEFIESPEALAQEIGKFEKTFEKNSKLVYIIGGGILAAVLLYFGYQWYVGSQDKDAQAAMSSAVFAYEADSLNKALNGSGGGMGMKRIADEYSGTKAANLAHLYAGSALVKQGKFDEAIEHLKSFSASDLLVQGRAYALIGDAYMEKNSTDDAIDYYKKAASYNPSAQFTPGYLMKLAIAQEKGKKTSDAIETYSNIIEKYPTSQEAVNAKKFKGALEVE
jgi:TolA-binding protein